MKHGSVMPQDRFASPSLTSHAKRAGVGKALSHSRLTPESARRKADPLADAVVAAITALPDGEGQRLLDLALDHGIEAAPGAPPALRELFAQLDSLPRLQWADPARCNLGGATFLRCRLGAVVLACLSL